jgi:tRNA threonylcarbamoyladenosine biosynthesis protein TsaE
MTERRFVSRSPAATRRLAAELARSLGGRGVIALHGDLGSGKTCFVQGLADALGIRRPITSPTFTIAGEYRGDRSLYHLDLYRLRSPEEMLALGFEEYLEADGITAVEWAERAGDLIPPDAVHVHLEASSRPRERTVVIRRPDGP